MAAASLMPFAQRAAERSAGRESRVHLLFYGNDRMFTGIVENTGTIVSTRRVAAGRSLVVDAGFVAQDAAPGASVSVSGVCLTVTTVRGSNLAFDVIAETIDRTNLARLAPGARVNLERSIRPDGRLEGHFVQGHVDGTAQVTRRLTSDGQWVLWLRPDAAVTPYIIPKGSVAVDGVSLTIAAVDDGQFAVALIPTTLERTTLGDLKVADAVNIESDIIARTIVHYLQRAVLSGGVTLEHLREHGFM